jgi:hypothetical protein
MFEALPLSRPETDHLLTLNSIARSERGQLGVYSLRFSPNTNTVYCLPLNTRLGICAHAHYNTDFFPDLSFGGQNLARRSVNSTGLAMIHSGRAKVLETRFNLSPRPASGQQCVLLLADTARASLGVLLFRLYIMATYL